jgi:hypothetical protein
MAEAEYVGFSGLILKLRVKPGSAIASSFEFLAA